MDPEECLRICGASVGCSNIAYPKLVMELMPVGTATLCVLIIILFPINYNDYFNYVCDVSKMNNI